MIIIKNKSKNNLQNLEKDKYKKLNNIFQIKSTNMESLTYKISLIKKILLTSQIFKMFFLPNIKFKTNILPPLSSISNLMIKLNLLPSNNS